MVRNTTGFVLDFGDFHLVIFFTISFSDPVNGGHYKPQSSATGTAAFNVTHTGLFYETLLLH